MTREETLAIMAVLRGAYPMYYRDMKRSEAESVVALWTEMFKDDDAQVVALAVKAHIANDKKGFPPHIGAIKEAIVKITAPEEMTEAEAWALVVKAIRNGNYGSEKEFEALPPVLQRLVGSPHQLKEWAAMDADVVSSVVASNFQRSYKARAAHEREQLSLPGDVRAAMIQIADGMKMPELESKPEPKPLPPPPKKEKSKEEIAAEFEKIKAILKSQPGAGQPKASSYDPAKVNPADWEKRRQAAIEAVRKAVEI